MAKVRVTGLDELRKRTTTELGRAIKTSNFQETLVQGIADEVRKRGVKPDLAASTVKQRKYLAGSNSTHPSFSPGKSNLTFSGQLLDSLTARYLITKKAFVIDAPKKKHLRYIKGAKKTARLTDILGYVTDQGRSILQIFNDKSFVSKLSNKLVKAIKSQFRDLT